MKTSVSITMIITSIVILAVILHTELFGEHATYGECIVTSSSTNGVGSSVEKSVSENQCKQSCVWSKTMETNEKQKVSCKFQTVLGYGWVASPEEFEDMVDKRLFSPSH